MKRGLSVLMGSVIAASLVTVSLVTVSLLTVSLLTGCRESREKGSEYTDVLYHSYYSEPYVTLDPSTEQSNGVKILHNVYETLTRYNDRTDEVEPLLATNWISNEDGTQWVFRLREDVTFHDGEKMNAEAVKKSIDRTINLGKGAAYIWNSVDSIEVTGEYEVTFHLSYSASIPLIASAGYAAYIMSPNVLDKDVEWFNDGNDGGSGPYTISTASARAVTLAAYEGYRGGWEDNQYQYVYIQEVPDSGTRRELLEKGESQLASDFSIEDLKALGEDDKFSVLHANTFTNVILMLNTKSAPCNNKDFRKALAYAFPYEETVDEVLAGYGARSHGMIPAGLWGHSDDLMRYDCDLEKAGEYVKRSGLTDVTVTVSYMRSNTSYSKMLEIYKDNLARIGVTLKLLGMDWDAQRALAGSADPDDCQDIMLMQWWPDYADPASWFSALLVNARDSVGYNFCYLDDGIFESVNKEAVELTATDRDAAKRLYIQMQETIMDECYMIFAYDMMQNYVISNRISGVYENPAYQTCVYYYDISKN